MELLRALGLSYIWLVYIVGFVEGQTVQELLSQTPECALSCLASEVVVGGCTSLDLGDLSPCLCRNNTMLTALSACVRLSCDVNDQIPASDVLHDVCHGYPEESLVTTIKVITIVTIAVTIPSISLRWIARYQTVQLGWDDYTALIAAICLIILATISLASAFIGFGLHVWDVDPRDAKPLLQLYWVSQQFYIIDQLFIKVSILCLYARVFPARWFKWTVHFGVVFISLQDVIYLFCTIFRCTPIQTTWDIRQPGKCLDLNLIGISGAILGITEHFIILLLPLPELWKLNLSRRKRLELASVFVIGSFSCVTSIIRLKHVGIFAPTADLSWDTVPVVTWSIIEDLSAVVCINLPPCRHLLGKLLPANHNSQFISTTQQYRSGGYPLDSKLSSSSSSFFMERSNRSAIGVTTTITSTYSKDSSSSRRSRSWFTVSAASSPVDSLPPALPSPMEDKDGVGGDRIFDGTGVAYTPPWLTEGEREKEQLKRPHTAHVFDGKKTLDVDIDRSELGIWEAFGLGRKKRFTTIAKLKTRPNNAMSSWF